MKPNTKQAQPKISTAIHAAFEKWMAGAPRAALRRSLGKAAPKSLRQVFVQLSGAKDFASLVAQRRAARKATKKATKAA